MGFDDTDDEVSFPDFNDPPLSPFPVYVHPRSPVYGPVVNALDREKEAEILLDIHTKDGKALTRRSSNEDVVGIVVAVTPQSQVGGSSASSSTLPLTVIPSTPSVLPIAADTATFIPTPKTRSLKREHPV